MIIRISSWSLIFIVLLSSCTNSSNGAKNTIVKQYDNTAGTRKAIVFLKEGGATVADSYQVLVSNHDHILGNSEVGNVFTVDTNHDQTRLDSGSISLRWISNDTLLVEYDKKLRTFIQESKVEEVSILYRPK